MFKEERLFLSTISKVLILIKYQYNSIEASGLEWNNSEQFCTGGGDQLLKVDV